MKKWVLLAMLVLAMAIYVWAGSYHEERDATSSFVFLGGDSTAETVVETIYNEVNLPSYQYRFNYLTYQADVSFGSLQAGTCSLWVMLQHGPGVDLAGAWDSLQTFIITGDSLYSTTGYNLIYTWAADSAKPNIRIRTIVQTESTGNAPLTNYVDSTYSVDHSLEVWGHD